MSTWWRARYHTLSPVEVERCTDESVWSYGHRNKRITEYQAFFPTWSEAHAHLMARAEAKLRGARRQLEIAQGEHGNIKGMKMPPGAE